MSRCDAMNNTGAWMMRGPEPRRAGLGVRRMGALAMGAAIVLLASCGKPSVQGQGKDGAVTATYSRGTLEAELPCGRGGVSALAVRAAAEMELRRRGLVIIESTGTDQSMRVVASGSGSGGGLIGDDKDVEVTVRADAETGSAGNTTRVRVDSGLFGDEGLSRSVLDGILGRLGR